MGNLLNYLTLGKNLFEEFGILEGIVTKTFINSKGIKGLSKKNKELGEIFQKMFEGSQQPALELTLKAESNYTVGGILLKDGEKTLSRGAVSVCPNANGEQLIKGHIFDSNGVGKCGYSVAAKNAEMSAVKEIGQKPNDSIGTRMTKDIREKRIQLLFSDFDKFIDDSLSKLDSFKPYIPEKLYNELKQAMESKNFALNDVLKNYYSGLNKCKTLREVEQLYPELKIGKLDIESEIYNRIKESIPRQLSDNMSKYTSYEDKLRYAIEEIEKRISEQARQWPIQDVIETQVRKIAEDMVRGNFVGNSKNCVKALNWIYPIRYNLLKMENREQYVIDILKKMYIENLPNREVVGASMLKSLAQELCYASRDTSYKSFRKVMENIESYARQFKDLGNIAERDLRSVLYTQSWRTSGLSRELPHAAKRSLFPRIKSVWIKKLYPKQEHKYTTDNLIEAYLKARYSCGNIEVESANPLTRYFEEGKKVDKFKFVSRLYALCDRPPEIPLRQQSKFQEFKSKFDIEAMKIDFEKMEEHYKNAFFKKYWTDWRTATFIEALKQNKSIADKNIELTDYILTEVMNEAMLAM